MSVIKYLDYLIREADEKQATKGEKKVKLPDQKMILSDKFRKVLQDIQSMKQSNISKRLLELETPESDRLFDYSYVDVTDDGENVTFLQASRIERLKKEGKPIEEFWTSKMRTPQKIGRFITQTLPKFSEESIQKFVKKFKTILKEAGGDANFELVEGDDIVFWYDIRNYDSEYGTLGSSCMSGPEAGRYLSVYKNNPNQCKLLILKNTEGDKIKGRALVWKLSKPDHIFMDRVYTNKDEDELLFTNYAKREGWLCKDEQVYGGASIKFPDGKSKEIDLEVILDNVNFQLYPYVDTLRYFYKETKMMASHRDATGKYITLTDTEGHYEEWRDDDDDYDPMVWDAYNEEEIPESRAQWCQYDNVYCASADAIRLAYNNTYALPKSPKIVWSDYTKKWYAKEDCEFSKPLNCWIWKKYAVQVYHDPNKQQPPDITHRFENQKTIGKVGDDYFDIDLLVPLDSKKVPGKEPGKVKTEITYGFK